MVVHLALDKVRTDGGTQMRETLDKDTFFAYRDVYLEDQEKLPPIVVFHDGATHWLADGFHRFYGAREAKLKDIQADIRQGTQRDAILYAVGANDSHGLQRKPGDKKQSVRTLLSDPEWCQWSNGVIAQRCKVTPQFVGDVRRQLETVSSSTAAKQADKPRTGKDGKTRSLPKPKTSTSNTSQSETNAETRQQRLDRLAREQAREPGCDESAIGDDARPEVDEQPSDWKKKAISAHGALVRALDQLKLFEKHKDNLRNILKDIKAAA